MIFEIFGSVVQPVQSQWEPQELELEDYLASRTEDSSNAVLFDAKIFGEQLLLLEQQVFTKQAKRADMIALDQSGNGVFIELKKRVAKQGVETQALQYLANYANMKGERFLSRFNHAKGAIDEFLGEYDINDLNRQSRIILVARSFDDSLFSMGEWLASQGVAFRCIQYFPFKVGDKKFLSFSVRFDRSREPLYQLSWEPRRPQYFWHNLGSLPGATNDTDHGGIDAWVQFHRQEGLLSASFSNEPGDAGDRILNSYVAKNTVIAYASGYGAVGWGVIESPSYSLVDRGYDRFSESGLHRHRLEGMRWMHFAPSVRKAVTAKELKENFNLAHPIQTKSRIKREQAEALIAEMKARFRLTP